VKAINFKLLLWLWALVVIPILSALLVDLYYRYHISYLYDHNGMLDGILVLLGLVALEILLKVRIWFRIIWGAVYLLSMAVVIQFLGLITACLWGDCL
jgi:hypothetical protein